MKNKTWKNYLGAAALVTVLFAGSVSAYFTDQDEKVNTFTVGKVTIELEEPKWEKKPDDNGNKIPDEAERMTPNQTIIKDPQVKNTGNNDAFIYMTVEVPCRQIISVNNDGTRNPLAMRELYNYQVDNSWKLLGTVDVSDESGKKVAVKHLYAYAGAQGICTVVCLYFDCVCTVITCKFFEHIFRHSENIATHSIIAGSDCTNFECFCYCFTTMIFEIKGHSIPNLRFPMVNIINTFGITYN